MSDGSRARHVHVNKDRCPYCHDDIATTPERTACNACAAWHHQSCWDEHQGCSACGFQRPEAEAATLTCDWSDTCQAAASEQVAFHVFCPEHARHSLRWKAGLLVLVLIAGCVLAAVEGREAYHLAGALALVVPAVLVMLWIRLRRLRLLADETPRRVDPKRTQPAGERPEAKP